MRQERFLVAIIGFFLVVPIAAHAESFLKKFGKAFVQELKKQHSQPKEGRLRKSENLRLFRARPPLSPTSFLTPNNPAV